MFLLSAPLVPDIPEADRKRRAALSRELAVYSTPAQRRDLEATLDQYPDNVTYELRDILASQATVHCSNGSGQHRRQCLRRGSAGLAGPGAVLRHDLLDGIDGWPRVQAGVLDRRAGARASEAMSPARR